jgi:hypothetical protein
MSPGQSQDEKTKEIMKASGFAGDLKGGIGGRPLIIK